MRTKVDLTDLSEFASSRAALSGALHVLRRINVDPGTGFAGIQLHLICPTGKSVNFCLASGLSVQIFSQKYLACSVGQITATSFGHPVPLKRGASRSSRTLGAGCDGRGRCKRRMHRTRTAKPRGPDISTLISSQQGQAAGDGDKKA
jgi:hypothetical protein